jgi:hypothetical protein
MDKEVVEGFGGTKDILAMWTSLTNQDWRVLRAALPSLNECARGRSMKSSANLT